MNNFKDSHYHLPYMWMHFKNRVLQLNPYEGMTFFSLQRFFSGEYLSRKFIPFNYYEFGVARGYSAKSYMKGLYWFSKYKKIRIHDFHMFLFDSFQGMPPANNEQEMGATYEGEFKGSLDTVKQRLNSGKTKVNLHFIKGFFNESLTQELLKTLKEHPPSLVRIDVILFSSATNVLNFIKPILQNGTIVYFQNLEAYLNSPFKGEMNALNNFNKMYEKEKAVLWPVQAPFGIQLLQNHAYVYSSLDENAIPKI